MYNVYDTKRLKRIMQQKKSFKGKMCDWVEKNQPLFLNIKTFLREKVSLFKEDFLISNIFFFNLIWHFF